MPGKPDTSQGLISAGTGEIHVWRASLNAATPLAQEFIAILDDEERRRSEGFIHHSDRADYIARRAILRLVISRYTGNEPRSHRFQRGKHGKPFLCNPQNRAGIQFNLSFSGHHLLIAVTARQPVGVDIERAQTHIDHLDIARLYFPEEEYEYIRQQPPPQQTAAFYRIWTMKEAYVKALGQGMSLDLKKFTVLNADRKNTCPEIREIPTEQGYYAAIALMGKITKLSFMELSQIM